MRIAVVALLWLATLAGAFHLGGTLGQEDAPVLDPVGGRGDPREAPPAAPFLAPASVRAPGEASKAEGPAERSVALAEPESSDSLPPFTFEGVTNGDEAMERLRRYVAAYLAEGKEGHKKLLRFLNEHVIDNDELKAFMGNDRESVHLIYPWLRFLVHREEEVVATIATVYETMAEDPAFFEGFDNDTIELFTEALPMVLPGAVGDEGLDRFRVWAQQILDTDENLQPEPLRRQRSDLQRVLAVWAPRLTPEEAIQRMREGKLTGQAALPALKALSPEQLADLDLGSLLVDGVRQGDRRVITALRELPLTGRDLDLLDAAILEGRAQWRVHAYLRGTNRLSWPAAQGLVERGLALGKERNGEYAAVLSRLDPKPPADYVAWVLDTYEIPEKYAPGLRATFGLR